MFSVKTLEERLRNYTDTQYAEYIRRRYCEGNKQVLVDMLEDLELDFDKNENMETLIIKFREEITDYVLETYYNG